MEHGRSITELLRSIAELLSWQWVVLILALIFRQYVGVLIARITRFRVGGKKGFEATLTGLEQGAGKFIEAERGEQKPQKRLDAELFVLRDAQGKERAKMGVTNTNATSLSLYDPAGIERVSIFVLADGTSSVSLADEQNVSRTMLFRSEMTGVDGLAILGPDMCNGSHLLVSSEGYPSLSLTDQQGTVIFDAERTNQNA
jgi:hypothetical protein